MTLSRVLALLIVVVLFVELMRGKRSRCLLTLSAGAVMVLVVLLGSKIGRASCRERV